MGGRRVPWFGLVENGREHCALASSSVLGRQIAGGHFLGAGEW